MGERRGRVELNAKLGVLRRILQNWHSRPPIFGQLSGDGIRELVPIGRISLGVFHSIDTAEWRIWGKPWTLLGPHRSVF